MRYREVVSFRVKPTVFIKSILSKPRNYFLNFLLIYKGYIRSVATAELKKEEKINYFAGDVCEPTNRFIIKIRRTSLLPRHSINNSNTASLPSRNGRGVLQI